MIFLLFFLQLMKLSLLFFFFWTFHCVSIPLLHVIPSPINVIPSPYRYLEGNMLTSVPKELAALKQLSLVYVAVAWPWAETPKTPSMHICRGLCCLFVHWPSICIYAGIWATTASARWLRSPSATWRNWPHCKLPFRSHNIDLLRMWISLNIIFLRLLLA